MTDFTTITKFTQDPEGMRLFQQERLIMEVTELMCRTMKEQRMKRSQLAEHLGLTRGRISQILNNGTNLTLRTVADIFTLLGKTLVVSAEEIFVVSPESRKVEAPARTESWPASSGNMWSLIESTWTQDHENETLAT